MDQELQASLSQQGDRATRQRALTVLQALVTQHSRQSRQSMHSVLRVPGWDSATWGRYLELCRGVEQQQLHLVAGPWGEQLAALMQAAARGCVEEGQVRGHANVFLLLIAQYVYSLIFNHLCFFTLLQHPGHVQAWPRALIA
jgi:hypothetical protein